MFKVLVWCSFLYSGGVFNQTIIAFALVGYEIMHHPYPMRARGMIFNYCLKETSFCDTLSGPIRIIDIRAIF